MKRSKVSEEQVAFALRQAESGTPVSEVPAARGERGDVLCVEEEVRPPGRERAPAPAPARGGKRAAETRGRRPHAGQAHSHGDYPKKPVTPTRRRERARWMME